jgi:hypothetical protein
LVCSTVVVSGHPSRGNPNTPLHPQNPKLALSVAEVSKIQNGITSIPTPTYKQKNYPQLRTYTIVEKGIGDIKLSKRDIEM